MVAGVSHLQDRRAMVVENRGQVCVVFVPQGSEQHRLTAFGAEDQNERRFGKVMSPLRITRF